ncbi:MAG: TRAP-type mannitol/chloroaromatic compound transport system permease small subunit [Pseudorhodobacter sp.]|jgi:TRAP-type mannitol/chloroaromatic compound transport system permease small subunit
MRSDSVIKMIEARLPRLGLVLNTAFDVTGGVLFAFIAQSAFKRFMAAWEGGFYLGNQGSFTAPTWPMELIVAVGSALVCLLFFASALRNLSVLVGLIPANGGDKMEVGGVPKP